MVEYWTGFLLYSLEWTLSDFLETQLQIEWSTHFSLGQYCMQRRAKESRQQNLKLSARGLYLDFDERTILQDLF